MPDIYFEDGTSYMFDQEKFTIIFEGMKVLFLVKKEHERRNLPKKMILDYQTKILHCIYPDGFTTSENFKGVI